MKTTLHLIALSALLAVIESPAGSARAQGTAFTYQGRLNNGGSLANGSYDLAFTLFNTNLTGSAIAGPVTNQAIVVSNGLFTTTVDFGPGVFAAAGTNNWLAIAVSTNAANSFSPLSPRQQITPAPYAIYSTSAATATSANGFTGALAGDVTGAQSATVVAAVGGQPAANVAAGVSAANSATSADTASTLVKRDASGNFMAGTITATAFSGNGAGLTNLNASQLVGGVVSTTVLPGFQGGANAIGGGQGNTVNGTLSGILGGFDNTNNANQSSIGGGAGNLIQSGSYYSFIGSGGGNVIQTNAYDSVIGGGYQNTVGSNAIVSVIGGGQFNLVANNAGFSVIGGGLDNTNLGSFSVIAGGVSNSATAYAFAAGVNAHANNPGAFVWSDDSSGSPFSSTSNNQFAVRASGSVRLVTAGAGMTLDGQAVFAGLNGGSLTNLSLPNVNGTLPASTTYSVGGNQSGGFGSPVLLVNNLNTSGTASPALRVVASGDTSSGALSVSSQGTGLIAQFGNGLAFVSSLDTNGNWTANSFTGNGSGLNALNASQLSSGVVSPAVLPGFQSASNYSTINGGQNDSIALNSDHSSIGGGWFDTINANDYEGTIPGGYYNSILAGAGYATIGGGEFNTNSSGGGTIAGGQQNVANGQYQSSVGGGYNNTANGSYATVPGGYQNVASGTASFAAGSYAHAAHQGSIVLADNSSSTPFSSTANNQFAVRATGGVSFSTAGAGVTVDGQPVARSSGTPISSAPFSITQPGSYYLTTNLTVPTGDAIDVNASGVTLDLNGFTISSTSSATDGNAIYLALANGNTDVTILNGHIVSGTTYNGSSFVGAGFYNGIMTNGTPFNIRVSGVSVSGVIGNGINLGITACLVDDCSANTVGGIGIYASQVSHCNTYNCGNYGIYSFVASDCWGTAVGGGTGLLALNANNCLGTATGSGIGLEALTAANNCFGSSVSGIGLYSANTATGCTGGSNTGVGIQAKIANACSINGGTTNIAYKYNMP